MKIVFFGSDEFGIPSLEEIKNRFNLVAVVTTPDKPKGRGFKILPTPIKEWAVKNSVSVYQPEKFDENFINILKELSPDFIVLISYGKILPLSILQISKKASINLHPSLLPKYRGPAPIEWALINGEKETGITVIKMSPYVDKGEIIIQEKVIVDEKDNIFTLKKKLMEISPFILLKGIEFILSGKNGKQQNGELFYARKLKKEDGLIVWSKSSTQIYNLIRGVLKWPSAYTFLSLSKGKKCIKIWEVEVGEEKGSIGKPGEIVSVGQDFIEVACGEGSLKIKKLQIEGKKVLTTHDFLLGIKLSKGIFFNG